AVAPVTRAVGLEEVVPAAVAGLGPRAQIVDVAVPESLPPGEADRARLGGGLPSLVDTAVAPSPPDAPVRVEAGEVGDRVLVRIVDRGPGIPASERGRVLQPFQRAGDRRRPAPR